jgi:hypothetical protein
MSGAGGKEDTEIENQGGTGEGGGAGSEAGSGGQPTDDPPPPAVRGTVLVEAGESRCAGILWSNQWVITTNHCIPAASAPIDVVVTLGADQKNPVDIQVVKEIVRYTEDDGGMRDIALLKLEQGMLIEGTRHGYYVNLAPWPINWIISLSATCVGWNLGEGEEPSRYARERPFWIETVKVVEDVGEVIQTLSDSAQITSIDEGGGCFFEIYGLHRVVMMMLGPDEALNLNEPSVRNWLFRQTLEQSGLVQPTVAGNVTGIVTPLGNELYWTSADGALVTYTWPSNEATPKVLAPAGSFLSVRPAIQFLDDERLVVAVALDGTLRFSLVNDADLADLGDQGLEFYTVEGAPPTSTGLGIAALTPTDVRLFFRDGANAIRMGKFDGVGWSDWISLGGQLASAPSAVAWSDKRIDVFARGIDNHLNQAYLIESDGWSSWVSLPHPMATGAPVVTSWGGRRLDVFWRSNAGVLMQRTHDRLWNAFEYDSGIPIASGEPVALSPFPGRVEFVEAQGGTLRRVMLPR